MSNEVFSVHLLTPGLFDALTLPLRSLRAPGLQHAEVFWTMRLGAPVFSWSRYSLRRIAVVAWWSDVHALEEFLRDPARAAFASGWHVRLKPYRRWGRLEALSSATIDDALSPGDRPVVAVTLARLAIRHLFRFTRFGKPVERQVRDHPGKLLALAAIRPFATFCTFSIWRSESEMTGMVGGRDPVRDGDSHRAAMVERSRQDFHREFTTMRFVPIGEHGRWDGHDDFTRPRPQAER